MDKGFINAKLVLNEPRAIYYSGQMLMGHIECELAQPLSYSAIHILYIGEGNVEWTEHDSVESNGVRRTIPVKYKAHEEYFKVTKCISGGPVSGIVNLAPGKHNIPFQQQIPFLAPSSFNGEYGSITYKVIAYIEYPDPTMERDQLEKAFDVVAALDLNADQCFKEPINSDYHEVYTCCCSARPLSILIQIPANGFCPGQAIPITVITDNQTNMEIKKIIFQLVQKERYYSKDPPSEYVLPEEVLSEVKTGAILSNTKGEINCDLMVPEIIAPNLESCGIIDVGYFIKSQAKLSGCTDNIEDEMEITIGFVPLEHLLGDRGYTHPMQSDLPISPRPVPITMIRAPLLENTPYADFQQDHPTAPPSYSNEPAPPYPNGVAPYPNAGSPYPNAGSPYPNAGSPYPGTAYPIVGTPYPNPNAAFPTLSETIPLMTMSNQFGFITNSPNNSYPPNNAPYSVFGSPTAPPQ